MGQRTREVDQLPDLELTKFGDIRNMNVINTRRGWKLLLIWLILLALTFVPWPWFYDAEPLTGGWLPFPLLYFWVVEFIYVGFVIYVGVTWAEAKMEAKDEMTGMQTSNTSVGDDV